MTIALMNLDEFFRCRFPIVRNELQIELTATAKKAKRNIKNSTWNQINKYKTVNKCFVIRIEQNSAQKQSIYVNKSVKIFCLQKQKYTVLHPLWLTFPIFLLVPFLRNISELVFIYNFNFKFNLEFSENYNLLKILNWLRGRDFGQRNVILVDKFTAIRLEIRFDLKV